MLGDFVLVNAEHQRVEDRWQVVALHLVALVQTLLVRALVEEGTRLERVFLARLVAHAIRRSCASSVSQALHLLYHYTHY